MSEPSLPNSHEPNEPHHHAAAHNATSAANDHSGPIGGTHAAPAHAATRRAWYRRPAVWIVALAAFALLAVGVPFAYAQYRNATAPAPFIALSESATPAATPTPLPSVLADDENAGVPSSPTAGSQQASVADGDWQVTSGSQAGYRVDEVLNGQDVTVVGRTDKVTGALSVTGGVLTAVQVQVDLASVTTDSASRDGQFSGSIMQTDQYATATFVAGDSVPLDPAGGTVSVPGMLTIKDRGVEVNATVQYAGSGASATANGRIPIVFADWGITPPDLGFVKVEDHGTVEFQLKLTKQ